jgi:16S rRNA (uracil1498-N3)-methyltransferase
MHRFFVNRESIINNRVKITDDNAEQIRKVLRMKEGEEIFVLDGHGWEYKVQLIEIKKGVATGEIKSKDFKSEDTKIKIILGQGIPKGEKMDFIVQKATELGVSEIVPLILERCIVKIKSKDSGKINRWRRISKESAEQAMRRFIPSIHEPSDLMQFCNKYKDTDLKIVFYEEEEKRGLRDLLEAKKEIRTLSIIVGPEGGLNKKEVEIANSYEFVSAGLGQRILRADTTALTALSILQFLYGDLG